MPLLLDKTLESYRMGCLEFVGGLGLGGGIEFYHNIMDYRSYRAAAQRSTAF